MTGVLACTAPRGKPSGAAFWCLGRIVAVTTAFRSRKETSSFWEKFWRLVRRRLKASRHPVEKRFRIDLLQDRWGESDTVRKLLGSIRGACAGCACGAIGRVRRRERMDGDVRRARAVKTNQEAMK